MIQPLGSSQNLFHLTECSSHADQAKSEAVLSAVEQEDNSIQQQQNQELQVARDSMRSYDECACLELDGKDRVVFLFSQVED